MAHATILNPIAKHISMDHRTHCALPTSPTWHSSHFCLGIAPSVPPSSFKMGSNVTFPRTLAYIPRQHLSPILWALPQYLYQSSYLFAVSSLRQGWYFTHQCNYNTDVTLLSRYSVNICSAADVMYLMFIFPSRFVCGSPHP